MNITLPKYRHIISVHINDYYQCGVAGKVIPHRHWSRFEQRAEIATQKILDLLDRHDCKATFFSSGWIADQCPDLIRTISSRGHELASTGYHQLTVRKISPEEFRREVVDSRKSLEAASQQEIIGYRCAGWLKGTETWALEILAGEGFKYDSSFYPFGFAASRHVPDRPHVYEFPGGRRIVELPISAIDFGTFRFPVFGGTSFRQLPEVIVGRQIDRWDNRRNDPLLFYFQVTELDSEQPRLTALSFVNRLQKYRNIDKMPDRISDLLERYSFTSAANYLDEDIAETDGDGNTCSAPSTIQTNRVSLHRRSVSVVVPCFNEQESISYLVRALGAFEAAHGHEFEIDYIIIDDASTDDTMSAVEKEFGDRDNVTIIQHEFNQGVAAATLTGIRAATSDTVCVIDSDCSYDPELLATMIPELTSEVALVTASPYHPKGTVVNVPGWRLFLSRGLSFLYRRVLRTKIATYTACVRIYRREAAKDIRVSHGGFLGIAEILARLDQQGERIVEVPAVLEARMLGQSKMKTLETIIGHLNLLMKLSFNRRLTDN